MRVYGFLLSAEDIHSGKDSSALYKRELISFDHLGSAEGWAGESRAVYFCFGTYVHISEIKIQCIFGILLTPCEPIHEEGSLQGKGSYRRIGYFETACPDIKFDERRRETITVV